VAATSGGGALNLVAGSGEAPARRVPVWALVGQTPTPIDGSGSFQDTSGRNGSLDAEAIAAARTGGPAVLLLPKNIQQSYIETPDIPASPANRNGHPAGELAPPFLTRTSAKITAAPQIPTAKENPTDVAASA
jgi:acetolactate synthase I/II/III large subunit